MPGVHVPISPGHDLTSHRLPAVSCDNRGMKFSWRRLLAATDVLVLALACVNCGGGAAGSTLSLGGGGGSGSGGSNSGGSGGSGGNSQSACSAMSTGQGASLNGFRPFGSDNLWNQDISGSPVDANSGAIINFIGPTIGMHADFGSGMYQVSIIGIPYSVVSGTQAPVNVSFTAYGSESDPGPMPLPANTQIEGGPNPTGGDRHVLVLDNDNCFLYELFSAVPNGNGSWNADSAAVWDLLSDANAQRPWTWTSADAAGLPIFSGLVRYDEVAAGQISHEIRFTIPQSRA